MNVLLLENIREMDPECRLQVGDRCFTSCELCDRQLTSEGLNMIELFMRCVPRNN